MQRSCERSPAEFWSKPLHACMALSGTGARLLHSDSEMHMPHMPGVLVRRAKAMFRSGTWLRGSCAFMKKKRGRRTDDTWV